MLDPTLSGVSVNLTIAVVSIQGIKVVMNRCPKIELFRPFWKPRLNQKI